MALESGLYNIEHLNTLVGRSLNEEESLLPKTISADTDNPDARWRVENLGDNKYKLFTIRAVAGVTGPVTGVNNGTVVAFLEEKDQQERAETWIITARPQSGEILYTIETESQYTGWVVPESEGKTPVLVRPLIVGESLPPHYPATELFKFVRLVDREED